MEDVEQPEVAHRSGQAGRRTGIGQPAPIEQMLDALNELLDQDRLDQVLVGARLHGARLGGWRRVGAHHQDRNRRILSPRGAAEGKAVGGRQGQVADQGLNARIVQAMRRVFAGCRSNHDEAGPAQRHLHEAQGARVAVRDEHRLLRHQPFRFPKRRPESTPPPLAGFLRRCSIRRSSSAASGWRGSISSALRNASRADSGSFVRHSTPAT